MRPVPTEQQQTHLVAGQVQVHEGSQPFDALDLLDRVVAQVEELQAEEL